MRYTTLAILMLSVAGTTSAGDWLTLPSTYSHDATGRRVAQYRPIEAPTAPLVALRSSGYTHTRSTLNYGQSADNYHREEKWGDPVRPYGEWRFPYRPFSTPYPNWGAPYAGFNLGVGGYGGGFGGGYGPAYPGRPPQGRPPVGGPGSDTDPRRGPRSQFDPINPDGIFREPRGFNQRPSDPNLFRPYPSGPGTPYPVAPYYDGYYPVYRD
jgi:hypothetical protein